MNLLMISSDRTLAAGRKGAFYYTLQELRKHFDRIDVICPRAKRGGYEMSIFGNVFVHPSPWPRVLQWLWIWKTARPIIRKQHPALMTVQEYAPVFYGLTAYFIHRATGVPYMLEIMHIPGVPRAAGFREHLYRMLMRMFVAFDARAAKAVRIINRHETPDFLIRAGVPREKLLYIPAFYIDFQTFHPQPELPKQYDLIFVGRLARNKGIDLFLDVVAHTGLTAIVVGDGPFLKRAKAKVSREKLKVNFHGFAKDADEIAGLINRSRLLLMTSLNEGGPRVVLETLACGVPVVATPVGIVPDVLPPECIEEWNVQDMSAKVMNILNDRELYTRLCEAGLFTVRQFERTAAIQNYADKIKERAQ